MTEFDYQWKNLPSRSIEYNYDRVKEFLRSTNFDVSGLVCLDAGCGNGRYTYAMTKLGGIVSSIDISKEAIKKCKDINPHALTKDIMELTPSPVYDFVLAWGVLHHMINPKEAFKRVASQLKFGGTLHVMVYHRDKQHKYKAGREIWKGLSEEKRIQYCEDKVKNSGGTIHGWYDAFNPTYNFSYYPEEIEEWFKKENFSNIKLIKKHNINMQGTK